MFPIFVGFCSFFSSIFFFLPSTRSAERQWNENESVALPWQQTDARAGGIQALELITVGGRRQEPSSWLNLRGPPGTPPTPSPHLPHLPPRAQSAALSLGLFSPQVWVSRRGHLSCLSARRHQPSSLVARATAEIHTGNKVVVDFDEVIQI